MFSRVLLVVVLLWFGSGWARADCTWSDTTIGAGNFTSASDSAAAVEAAAAAALTAVAGEAGYSYTGLADPVPHTTGQSATVHYTASGGGSFGTTVGYLSGSCSSGGGGTSGTSGTGADWTNPVGTTDTRDVIVLACACVCFGVGFIAGKQR